MIALARQTSVEEIGAGRWRVELELPPHAPSRPDPRAVTVRAATGREPRAHVESLAVPGVSARRRFSVVLALEGPKLAHPPAYELSGDGWAGRVQLATPPHEPRPAAGGAPAVPDAEIDFRARDFTALAQLMTRIVRSRYGGGLVEHPVAQTTALVEELAYLGDALSYSQDAVATEAHLVTARRRISVTRHAELLDYRVFEGRSARAWVRVDVSERMTLERGTQMLAGGEPPIVFETLEPVELEPGDGRYRLHDRHPRRGLAPGATAATVVGDRSGALVPGALVLVERLRDGAGASLDGSGRGHVVRLTGVEEQGDLRHLQWAPEDALPERGFAGGGPLCVRAGNLVLVEHGATQPPAMLRVPEQPRFWPELPAAHPAFTLGTRREDAHRSAAATLHAPGREPVPAVCVIERSRTGRYQWHVRPSLLESGPLARDFVVEMEEDRSARLRFGDGMNGMRPPAGAELAVTQRVGAGPEGNVGPLAISRLAEDDARVRRVGNPAPAVGGAAPETLASVRLNAPTAYRATQRAVVASDYEALARRVPGVVDAAAEVVTTAAGPLARVRVHGGDWAGGTERLVARVRDRIDGWQPIGVALLVAPAIPLPVTVQLDVAIAADRSAAAAQAEIDRALRDALLRPGSFGFGTGLYRSEVIGLVTALPGVLDVTLRRLAWARRVPGTPAVSDLEPPFGHIIRIDDDAAEPGRGSVSFRMRSEP